MTAALPVAAGVPLFLLGLAVVTLTFLSALSTVVVPRGVPVRLSRLMFVGVLRLFELRTRFARTYEERDRSMALYAPLTLVSLPVMWLTLVLLGATAMFFALGVSPLRQAFLTSGSSLLTLGFAVAPDLPTTVLALSEAVVGLILLALLITYLPSMYSAFSRREALVSLNAIQAGNPPSAGELLERFHVLNDLDMLETEVWRPWSSWFIDIEETHTSLGALAFFRSPQPERSWVTSAGSVLDAAAIVSSTVDVARQPVAELCIRTGYLSLRAIADFYGIAYDADPAAIDPIAVAREEFDEVVARLAAAGVPLRADLDRAWADFRGWRVNYDTVLIALAAFTIAPYAPWSSDRSPARTHRPPVRRRRSA